MSESKLLFQLGVSPEGKVVWTCRVPLAELVLLLERVKFEIVTGQVKEEAPAIVPATNGDLTQLKNRLPA